MHRGSAGLCGYGFCLKPAVPELYSSKVRMVLSGVPQVSSTLPGLTPPASGHPSSGRCPVLITCDPDRPWEERAGGGCYLQSQGRNCLLKLQGLAIFRGQESVESSLAFRITHSSRAPMPLPLRDPHNHLEAPGPCLRPGRLLEVAPLPQYVRAFRRLQPPFLGSAGSWGLTSSTGP